MIAIGETPEIILVGFPIKNLKFSILSSGIFKRIWIKDGSLLVEYFLAKECLSFNASSTLEIFLLSKVSKNSWYNCCIIRNNKLNLKDYLFIRNFFWGK